MIDINLASAEDIWGISTKPGITIDDLGDKQAFIELLDSSAVLYRFSRKGSIGAIIAISEIYPDIVEFYALTSNELKNAPVAYIRSLRWMLDIYHKASGIVRAQTFVRCDYAEGVRFMEGFGFEVEGRLRKYGKSKQDHYIMGKVF